VCLSIPLLAQEKGTIRGVVKDSLNSETLPFGNALIKEINVGTSTNNRGYFVIPSVPAGQNYTLIISYIGYKTKIMNVSVMPNKITELDILLAPSSIQLQAIEKVEYLTTEENVPDLGKTVITAKSLEVIPKGVETDMLRSLISLPGVQSTGDVSARYNVRGGESNQNLVLVDGIPLYYPFHAIGLFSVVDADVVNNAEFFRGGFPSANGRAISSILKISTRDGNKNQYSGKLSGSLLSVKGMIEGPIPSGSFYLTGRKSVSNKILNKFLNGELPVEFYDAAFKVNMSDPGFFSGAKFTLQGLFSGDELKYNEVTRPDYRWSNNLIGLKVFTVGSVPFFLDFGVSFSSYKNEIITKESGIKPKLNELYDFTISTDFLYVLDNKDEFGIGADVKSINAKMFLLNRFDFRADVGAEGLSSNAYINYKFLRFTNIGADIGIRANLKNLAAKGDFVEPRINMTYKVTDGVSLKGSYGIFQQELTTIYDEREVLSLFDPVVIIPDYLEKAKSAHYIFGISTSLTQSVNFDIESYYRKIYSAPTLNENRTIASDPDLIESIGESYGAEFLLNTKYNLMELNIGYTLSWAFKEANGIKYKPRYDSRHNINVSISYLMPSDFILSGVFSYHSGNPFTQQSGYFDQFNMNGFLENYYPFETITPIQYFKEKNGGTLPDYHRLDLMISKKIELGMLRMLLDISAVNIYNRKNIYYFEQTTGRRVNMLPFMLTGTLKIEI
jgi:hypothetical protein